MLQTSAGVLYPNLFTLLCAPPAVGKSVVISRVRDIWASTNKLTLAPNSATKAGLIDKLANSQKNLPLPNGELLTYSAVNVACSEFGTLVPAHDMEFLSVLNDLYDPLASFQEERRDKTRCVDIIHPWLNMICGTQPGFLVTLLPEEAWSMGFMSRNMIIYAASGPAIDLFADPFGGENELRKELVAIAKQGCEKVLTASFSAGYQSAVKAWQQDSNFGPVPTHSKLQHYLGRRVQIFLKLSLISAFSRTLTARIEEEDYLRAKSWLLGAELEMPDAFRDMMLKSDAAIIQDLHLALWRIWVKDKKPVHESKVWHFLQTHAVVGRIPQIIETAVRSRVLQGSDVAGQRYYVPRPTHEHGME
jgi:hypothetical protein